MGLTETLNWHYLYILQINAKTELKDIIYYFRPMGAHTLFEVAITLKSQKPSNLQYWFLIFTQFAQPLSSFASGATQSSNLTPGESLEGLHATLSLSLSLLPMCTKKVDAGANELRPASQRI